MRTTYFIPYESIVTSESSEIELSQYQKNDAEKLIGNLRSCLPKEKLSDGKDASTGCSGVLVETDNTHLFIEETSHGAHKKRKLFYGNVCLMTKEEADLYINPFCKVQFHEENYMYLPQTLMMSDKEIEANKKEESEVIDAVVQQEKDKLCDQQYDTRLDYSQPHISAAAAKADREQIAQLELHFRPCVQAAWARKGCADYQLKARIAKTLDKTIDKFYKVKAEEKQENEKRLNEISLLKKDLLKLLKVILNLKGHAIVDGKKYELLWSLEEKIKNAKFKNFKELKLAGEKVFALGLQQNKIDFRDTTVSGKKMVMLLNTTEYSRLKDFLFDKNSVVNYLHLLSFVGAPSIKFFSSRNKKKMYDFYNENQNNLLENDRFSEFMTRGKLSKP